MPIKFRNKKHNHRQKKVALPESKTPLKTKYRDRKKVVSRLERIQDEERAEIEKPSFLSDATLPIPEIEVTGPLTPTNKREEWLVNLWRKVNRVLGKELRDETMEGGAKVHKRENLTP